MAERRMFAKTTVLSDAFLDMPATTRCLYFTLGMVAYDKGIVVGARGIARATGATTEDIETLVARGYLVPVDGEKYKIVHWYENNCTSERRDRNTYEYRKWRESVIDRDGACVVCGSKENLVAHHVKPFAKYPALRTSIENGITLCDSCHRLLHRTGSKDAKQDH